MVIFGKLKSRFGAWVAVLWMIAAILLAAFDLFGGCTGHPCFPGLVAMIIAILFIPITIVAYFLGKWSEELHRWLSR